MLPAVIASLLSGVTGMRTELISDHNIVFGFAICACHLSGLRGQCMNQ